jgi:hypothetical protein
MKYHTYRKKLANHEFVMIEDFKWNENRVRYKTSNGKWKEKTIQVDLV